MFTLKEILCYVYMYLTITMIHYKYVSFLIVLIAYCLYILHLSVFRHRVSLCRLAIMELTL